VSGWVEEFAGSSGCGLVRCFLGGVFVVAVGTEEVGGGRAEVGEAVAGRVFVLLWLPPPQPALTAAMSTAAAVAVSGLIALSTLR
jgi:hypothetical protein